MNEPNTTGAADKAEGDLPQPDSLLIYKDTDKGPLHLHKFESKHAGDRPAIIFFFGGGWVGGTPTQFYPFAKHLTNLGIHAYCAEYRTENTHGTSPRACVEDGYSAIRYLKTHAEKENVDQTRIALGGGSAGGHVAAATALCSGFDSKDDDLSISVIPNALVLFNPVYDNSESGYGYDRVKDYWQDISPLHNIKGNTPPSIVFFGTNDGLISLDSMYAFQEKTQNTGSISELHLWEGAGHGFFNYGRGYYNEVLTKVVAFFKTLNWV